jgi:cyclopropane fatty-acyl-phospholipid synthase-like methyltransferase
MGYDRDYAKVAALFGVEAEPILAQFADRLKPDGPVLEIGAGQGRNAFAVAREGRAVHAVEPSAVAVEAMQRAAQDERLPLEVFCTTFERFDPPVAPYAGILVFGLVPDLSWPQIGALVDRIDTWSGPGTLLWATGFTTRDPAFPRYQTNCTAIGTNSFRDAEGRVRTYLEPGQVLELFEPYAVLHHWEGLGPEHRHGDGPPERHGKFEVVLRKAGG